ncbi:hypothetical protein Bca52824_026977 [Brassica carinata]|uniref:RNase H type-1 domain-containing protein n=1 Tax=Brassica carinata TaxID=52824 RepID=A0A8X7V9A6_BRACI|nr:hypothetical protein Bca52824_026977 [Brassica carinata]
MVNEDPKTTAPPAVPPPVLPSVSWNKPAVGVVKCNVGSSWIENGPINGSSWITRDHHGQILHHSRRAYSETPTKRVADLLSLFWAVQSMVNMRQRDVLFESSSTELRETLLHPDRFPEVHCLLDDITDLLRHLDSWSLCYVWDSRNKAASIIADSVIRDHRFQSYVARGAPCWLRETIYQESLGV